MKHLLLIGTLFSTTAFAASLRTNIDQQFLNAPVTRNYIKNSGAEKNDAGVTDASNIHSRTTSAPLEGDGSHLIDATASGQLVVFQADDFQDGLMGQNCEAKFDYSGDASLYKAYVRLAGVKVSLDTALVNASGTQSVSINFPCGNSTTDDPDLVIESTGNGAAIKVDSVYLGKATNIGNVAQPEMVLQVRRSGSDQIINTTADTKVQFNSKIIDVYNEYDATTNYRFTAKRAGDYLINVSLDYNTTVSIGVAVVRIYKNGVADVRCSRTMLANDYVLESVCILPLNVNDYIEVYSATTADSSYTILNSQVSQLTIARLPTTSEQVFRVGAPGQGWTAYTPTITHTSGGITNQTTTGYWRCEGSTLRGFIRTTFSNASAAFDGLRYSLPSGFTIDTTAAPIDSSVGNALLLDTGNVSVPSTVSVISSTALVVGYIKTGTTLDASPVKSIAISNSLPFTFNNTDTISINYTVPVTANSPCPAAPMPLLKHAVTTSSEGVERVERVTVRPTCTSSPCTILTSTPAVTSVTRQSAGKYTVNFASGTFSAIPTCTCVAADFPGAICAHNGETINSFKVDTYNGNVLADSNFMVICMGPR
jgi:hypothetical protein